MAQVFISYSTKDAEMATRLFQYLRESGIDIWYAPAAIAPSCNFAEEIGNALVSSNEDSEGRFENLSNANVFILLLSFHSMRSPWVKKEVKLAINKQTTMIVLRIDHAALTPEFEFLLSDIQIRDAYHLQLNTLEAVRKSVFENLRIADVPTRNPGRSLSYTEVGAERITCGDPYYEDGHTLKTYLTPFHFYLAPPRDNLSDAQQSWVNEHFEAKDVVFDTNWEQLLSQLQIPDLKNRIEESRQKIFQQFLNQENGCYFNNKKYGIYRIRPYGRTENLQEAATLELEFYTTDYFTHRVMKDVCKRLMEETQGRFLRGIKLSALQADRIFFTSLGINLLLLGENNGEAETLLTGRSVNAAETYGKHMFSVSAIEGVSLSDYDPYERTVDLTACIIRGLKEELGIERNMLQADQIRFYDLFVIRSNLEIGISCSVQLAQRISMDEDILALRGKDEVIEVAEKRVVPVSALKEFVLSNIDAFLPQAVYSIFSYLESLGVFVLSRNNQEIRKMEKMILGKDGRSSICGDAIVETSDYIAIIDGATPKGCRLWQAQKGDVYVSHLLADAMQHMDPDLSAQAAIAYLNDCITDVYRVAGIDSTLLPPEELLQASIIIYSVKKREIWSFGDCKLRINGKNIDHTKKVDQLLSDLRAFCIEIRKAKGLQSDDCADYGRAQILPFLKDAILLSNTDACFGYDALNGHSIHPEHVKVYAVQKGDSVVLASDGYPRLFDTLEETEQYLSQAIQRDPDCVCELRGTKGIAAGNVSFDDRSYISFSV